MNHFRQPPTVLWHWGSMTADERSLRKERNISQLKLALDLNMNQNSISRYENREREADYDTLIRFADYFDVSLDSLLGRTDEKNEINFNPHRSAKGIRCWETETSRYF